MSKDAPLDHARALLERGLAVIPVPHKSKKPVVKAWQQLRLTTKDLPKHFGSKPSNVGVLLGEPSGGIIDIDIDDARALPLADDYLPETFAEWGRASKPRSHRLYRVSGPVSSRRWQFASSSAGRGAVIVELRSTGQQTIAPGSVHPSGEPVRWDRDGEPTHVSIEQLLRCLEALSAAVKGEAEDDETIEWADIQPMQPQAPWGAVGPKMTPEEVVVRCAITGPGQHDAMTFRLARGLRWNAGMALFDCGPIVRAWFAAGRRHCQEDDSDVALSKFERAYESAKWPLDAGGVAAHVLGRLDTLPPTTLEAGFDGRARVLARVFVELGRLVGDEVFAMSAYQLADALHCSPQKAHDLVALFIRRGHIECVDRGRPGVDKNGRARRLRWIGGNVSQSSCLPGGKDDDTL